MRSLSLLLAIFVLAQVVQSLYTDAEKKELQLKEETAQLSNVDHSRIVRDAANNNKNKNAKGKKKGKKVKAGKKGKKSAKKGKNGKKGKKSAKKGKNGKKGKKSAKKGKKGKTSAKKGKKGKKGKKSAKKGKEGKKSAKKGKKGNKSAKKGKKDKKAKKGKKGKKAKKGKKNKKSKKGKKLKGKKNKKSNKGKKVKGKKNKKSKKGKKLKGKKKNSKGKNKSKKALKQKKLNKLKNKKSKKTGKQSSCSATQISKQGFDDMLTAMEYQRTKVFNFETQRKRAISQARITNGKREKAGDFLVPAKNLASALGLNTTVNMYNTTGASCGDGLTTSTIKEAGVATNDYLALVNCSITVDTACNLTAEWDNATETKYDACKVTLDAFAAKNTECQEKPIGEAAACWEDQVKAIDAIQKADEKCIQWSANKSDAVAEIKKQCVDTVFRACKGKEDAAVEHSANCTSGTVKSTSDINKEVIHTKETLSARGMFVYDPADDEDVDEDDIILNEAMMHRSF